MESRIVEISFSFLFNFNGNIGNKVVRWDYGRFPPFFSGTVRHMAIKEMLEIGRCVEAR
jgi:hypothetical protein